MDMDNQWDMISMLGSAEAEYGEMQEHENEDIPLDIQWEIEGLSGVNDSWE